MRTWIAILCLILCAFCVSAMANEMFVDATVVVAGEAGTPIPVVAAPETVAAPPPDLKVDVPSKPYLVLSTSCGCDKKLEKGKRCSDTKTTSCRHRHRWSRIR